MARAARDYSNGKIYIIESLEAKIHYIGSTCCGLRKRMANHMSRHRAIINGTGEYLTASEVLSYPDARILLVEDFPCDRKEQLDAREAHFIRNGSPAFALDSRCVNRSIPGRTPAGYYQDHREEIIARNRAYREVNKEAMMEASRLYNRIHREEINAANKAPKRCEVCDCSVRSDTMSKHLRSKKHASNLEEAAARRIDPVSESESDSEP